MPANWHKASAKEKRDWMVRKMREVREAISTAPSGSTFEIQLVEKLGAGGFLWVSDAKKDVQDWGSHAYGAVAQAIRVFEARR